MKSKPWPIIILAWFYFLAPVANILFTCVVLKASPIAYIGAFIGEKMWLSLFKIFAVFPLAGFAVYSFRRWSYPVFLCISVFALYSNYRTWVEFPQNFPLHYLIFAYLVNIGVVSYFLIPSVRATYYNPRLRWWESLPRYVVDFEAELVEKGGKMVRSKILNISKGGIFLRSSAQLDQDETVQVVFQAYGISIQASCTVVHVETSNALPDRGYGLKFMNLRNDSQMRKSIASLILILRKNGVELLSPRIVNKSEDFKAWAKTLVSTGKGLVPDVKPNKK